MAGDELRGRDAVEPVFIDVSGAVEEVDDAPVEAAEQREPDRVSAHEEVPEGHGGADRDGHDVQPQRRGEVVHARTVNAPRREMLRARR